MSKGRRQRERREAREGKGELAERRRATKERREREGIAELAIANGPAARTSATARAIEARKNLEAMEGEDPPLVGRPEYVAHMEAWYDAGCPRPTEGRHG